MAPGEAPAPARTPASLKSDLLATIVGTERGLTASSEARAEINELITALESMNPSSSPTESLEMLAGDWTLMYTSNSELFLLLAADRVPLVSIGDITQSIDAASGTVENKVQFTAPLVKSSVSANAAFEVRSPKRLSVNFTSGTIAVPTIFEDVVLGLPGSVTLMGQTIDLAPVQSALAPVQSAVAPAVTQAINAVRDVLKSQRDITFPVPDALDGTTTSWLLTTYLDGDTRIARGDGGSIFVLTKAAAIVEAGPATPAPTAPTAAYAAPELEPAAPAAAVPVVEPTILVEEEDEDEGEAPATEPPATEQ